MRAGERCSPRGDTTMVAPKRDQGGSRRGRGTFEGLLRFKGEQSYGQNLPWLTQTLFQLTK